ncbi:CHAT domain-containing tetratricopeptide repeat protein [Frigidibacter sp. ROC022]|uniref:CHAT domain-containing tetratricopeptide repeat protein n=1 Tax=Frigidibacter sp. ROC022 TaxID=2971796 RepID=UPI00215AC6B2|nr:CHAT domain-containing protein [Frigidibacter sp. ROC022]MCR8723570.1 CHAT domain-containing protein [Frigidibacter sp. ROC022]
MPILSRFALCFWLALAAVTLGGGPALAQADAEIRDQILAGQPSQLVTKAKAGDPYAQLELGTNLAEILQDASLREAIYWLEAAYDQFDAMSGDVRRNAGVAAWNIGYAYKDLSDFDEALVWFDAMLANARELSHLRDSDWRIASALELQGLTLLDLSRYPEALAKFEAARRIFSGWTGGGPEATGDYYMVNVASTWLHTGIALEHQERFEEAIAAYRKAMDLFEQSEGREAGGYGYAIGNIGVVYWRMGRFELARAWMERGFEFDLVSDGDFSINATKSRINLGLVSLDLGDVDQAIYWSMKALPWMVANRRQSLSDQRWVFETLQRAFAKKGEIDRAILFGKMAVNAQQEIRALNDSLSESETEGLRSEWRRLYQDLAGLLIGQGRLSEAQAVLNMEKEQEVFEFLQRDGTADLRKTQSLLSDSELDQQARLTALAQIPVAAEQELQRLYALDDDGVATDEDLEQIAVLEEALQRATDAFDAAVEGFLAEVGTEERGSFEAQFDSVGTYQDILDELDRPTAILQIAALDDATHLFLTLPGISEHFEVAVTRAELAGLVFEALQAIEDRDAEVKVPLRRLHDLLVAPVRPALEAAGIEVVMLNLDGFLRYVPFAALYDGEGYLVEDYALAIYSAAVPTQFRRGGRDADRTAGFGVTKAFPGFDALPGVKREIERIFGAEGGVLAGKTGLDEAFDEASLKRTLRGKPEILHIASHFALQPGQEDDSFLLLGDGAHLTLATIRKERALRFRGVDLLTLSACQTARGGDGSELDGFGATAQLSGASAVMASLWPVADEATPRLMALFYRNMIEGGMDKAEALRQAQLSMLAEGGAGGGGERSGRPIRRGSGKGSVGLDHPYFWSAFVLMGNWL